MPIKTGTALIISTVAPMIGRAIGNMVGGVAGAGGSPSKGNSSAGAAIAGQKIADMAAQQMMRRAEKLERGKMPGNLLIENLLTPRERSTDTIIMPGDKEEDTEVSDLLAKEFVDFKEYKRRFPLKTERDYAEDFKALSKYEASSPGLLREAELRKAREHITPEDKAIRSVEGKVVEPPQVRTQSFEAGPQGPLDFYSSDREDDEAPAAQEVAEAIEEHPEVSAAEVAEELEQTSPEVETVETAPPPTPPTPSPPAAVGATGATGPTPPTPPVEEAAAEPPSKTPKDGFNALGKAVRNINRGAFAGQLIAGLIGTLGGAGAVSKEGGFNYSPSASRMAKTVSGLTQLQTQSALTRLANQELANQDSALAHRIKGIESDYVKNMKALKDAVDSKKITRAAALKLAAQHQNQYDEAISEANRTFNRRINAVLKLTGIPGYSPQAHARAYGH